MSGLLVLFACLAVAVAIAIPTVARAAGPTTNNPANTMRKAGGEQEFLTLSGPIFIKGEYSKHKLSSTECKDLIVVAHKGIGDMSGPIVGKTNATLNGDGGCVYSLKVPADQDVTVGIQSFSWGGSKLSPSQYGKINLQDKAAWKYQKAGDVWINGGFNGDGFSAKIDYKEFNANTKGSKASKEGLSAAGAATSLNMPLYINLTPDRSSAAC
jgi:hypothetical protein